MKLFTCLWKYIHFYHDKVNMELKGDFMHQSFDVLYILKHAHSHVHTHIDIHRMCERTIEHNLYLMCDVLCFIAPHRQEVYV